MPILSTASKQLQPDLPDWFWSILGGRREEGETFNAFDRVLTVRSGLPRLASEVSPNQHQTEKTFGYKWKQRNTFESQASLARMREWLLERYGDPIACGWLKDLGRFPLVLDVGCGAGMSALEYFSPVLKDIRYLGVDVSEAVDIARVRFLERGIDAGFLQADLNNMPLPENSVDLVFSEGVFHHTDSTQNALLAVVRLLRKGGRVMFYVYRRKGPIREFTDDHIRECLQGMTPEEGWQALEPLTRLGIALGELDAQVDISEPVALLGIPAGRISVQRLFYWHVAKFFYREELSFDEMNHINFDWYAPQNAHRQSTEEVRKWCSDLGLEIEREQVEQAGITIVARKVSEP